MRQPSLWIDTGNAPFDSGAIDVMCEPYCGNAQIGDVILSTVPFPSARVGVWRIRAISGRSASVVNCLAGGGGGGATAFTQLTDAPATITPDAVVVGNSAGTALEQPAWFRKYPGTDNRSWVHESDNDNGGDYTLETVDSKGRISLYADNVESKIQISSDSPAASSFELNCSADIVNFHLRVGAFLMQGFDVVASDVAARLTIAGTQYAATKAIKVKIGADTYHWPLFGPTADATPGQGTWTPVSIAAAGPTAITAAQSIVLLDATSNNVTVTLPAANALAGRSPVINCKRIDSSGNTVTVQRAGSDNVEGGTSLTLSALESASFVTDGSSKWWRI